MNRTRSLSVQLFLDVLRSLLAAAAVFALIFGAGTYVLNETIYSAAFTDRMTAYQCGKLQEYVEAEQLTPENLRPLDVWCSQGDAVYLTIYLDGELLYESPLFSRETGEPEAYDPSMEDPEQEFTLIFSDGTAGRAFLYYYVSDIHYYWTVVLAGAGAFLVFSLCFIRFVHRKLRYVQQLKAELDILAGGDLSYPITVRGEDELGELAAGIDQMRRSIAAHQAAEERMRLANSELVTAMSHDLRTPLTSLLAYLELMERGKYRDQEQLRIFIHKSLEKTLQIKSMAEKLFEYFLVYTSQWAPPDPEEADADQLFRHLLGEYAFALENCGFTVEQSVSPLDGSVRVHLELLRRVFDNLYSNLLKYADPAVPVVLAYRREGGTVRLWMTNGVFAQREKRESTNIGLHTCEKILGCHGGTFSCGESGGRFRAELTLPLIPGEAAAHAPLDPESSGGKEPGGPP